jgi:leucyl aminopeptidase
MKIFIAAMYLAFSLSVSANEFYITTDSDIGKQLTKNQVISTKNTSIVKINKSLAPKLFTLAHEKRRCGGYFTHISAEEALQAVADMEKITVAPISYTVTDSKKIHRLMSEVTEDHVRATIVKLSSFKNRYYKSKTGVSSAKYIRDSWRDIGINRQDFSVELFEHTWAQPSVIATLKGKTDEVVVIGGHLDSISGWFGGDTIAPGADDNASGIASITEAMRVLVESGYTPQRTIKFMGYAAEEVGLKGSNVIAKKFKADGVKVVAVMQLDMTNFKGSDKTIHLVQDYTNAELTTFLGKLIDTYVKVPWGFTKCGYACSDHASWHKAGFAASYPFEAGKGDMNSKIHTAKDTIAHSGGNAFHAVNFSKLAIAFLVELGR